MDLSRLESWSELDLLREARRIGIWAPQRLSRRRLIERIREHHQAPLRRARRAFTKMVGLARDLASGTPRLRLGAEGAEPVRERPVASTTPGAAVEVEAKVDADAEADAAAAETEAEAEAEAEVEAEVEAEAEAEAEAEVEAEAEAEAEAEEAPNAPVLDDADRKILDGEPIQTRTMARILASQGHHRRAAAIYQKLLTQTPDDTELRAEADDARAGKTKTEDDEDEDGGGSECVVALAAPERAVVAWSVTEPAIRRAKALCGGAPTLIARVIVLTQTLGSVERKVEETPVKAEGELSLRVPPYARVIAAVGLRDAERFVSIAHAPVLEPLST